ncbi:ketopantoate reductase family protein [Aliidiomarina sp.]|uniref:ketopantoate reductase family protein n=1 Tax=Aliidiomarina sp. TaxID=1872439 RepID=UPI003A4E5732
MASSAGIKDLQSKLQSDLQKNAPDTQPTWVVVGTGALGSLWAHGLQQAGAPVMVYSRHASDGPEVELNVVPAAGAAPQAAQTPNSAAANITQKSIRARFPVIHSAAAAPSGAIWLIMVKAWQLEPLLRQILQQFFPEQGEEQGEEQGAEQVISKGAANCIGKAPMQLVLSHNGMGAADTMLAQAAQAGHVQVYDLVTTHGAWRQSRLSTVHAGLGESWLGLRSAKATGAEHATDTAETSTAAMNSLIDAERNGPQHALTRYAALAESNDKPQQPAWFHTLAQALPPLHWEANISARRWHKLAINCVINPLATIAGDVNGVLRKNEYQPKIRAICEEIGNLNPYLDADVLVASVQQVIRATANNRCSMLQDSEAGKPTEVDYLNGFICQEGTLLHVATRVNCELWHQLASSNTSKDKNEKE